MSEGQVLLERLDGGSAALPSDSLAADLVEQSTLRAGDIQELAEGGARQLVDAIPQGEAFDWLVAMTGESPQALTNVLYQAHDIHMVWYIVGAVGILTAFGIYLYGRWILALSQRGEELQ